MFKKLSLVNAISAILISGSVYSASMTVGFSQIGSESGWRAAETSVSKTEAAKRGITLKIADAHIMPFPMHSLPGFHVFQGAPL